MDKFIISKMEFINKLHLIIMDYKKLPRVYDSGKIAKLGDTAAFILKLNYDDIISFREEIVGYDEKGKLIIKQKKVSIEVHLILIHVDEIFELYFPGRNFYKFIERKSAFPEMVTKEDYEYLELDKLYELVD